MHFHVAFKYEENLCSAGLKDEDTHFKSDGPLTHCLI